MDTDFVGCTIHPCSIATFRNCTIDGMEEKTLLEKIYLHQNILLQELLQLEAANKGKAVKQVYSRLVLVEVIKLLELYQEV